MSIDDSFEHPRWGRRNNPACDDNIAALVQDWARHDRPLVYVRHDSVNPTSPLHRSSPGNRFKPYLTPTPDLLVTKTVNSAFLGTPDLDAWLRGNAVDGIVVCGITTNHCCETTARMGDNLAGPARRPDVTRAGPPSWRSPSSGRTRCPRRA